MTSIILAGGCSSRLGQAKPQTVLAGESLLQRVIQRLAPLNSEIMVVLSPEQQDMRLSRVKPIYDLYPGKGALGGIYSGLMAANDSHNLVVACDMPFLNPDLLRYMLELSPGFDVVVPKVGKNLEPLHAVYSKICLEPMAKLLKQGDLKISHLFDQVKVRYVEENELNKFDPEHLSFFNINTKADLNKAEEIVYDYSGTGTGEGFKLYRCLRS